jgi:aldehyde dehydrogenase (NAD+)
LLLTVVLKPADLVLRLGDRGYPAPRLPAERRLEPCMGRGSVVGQAMLDSPDLAGITFPGSTSTGKRVALASIEHNRKFQLDMGGKSPMVILDDADLSVAVEAPANSASSRPASAAPPPAADRDGRYRPCFGGWTRTIARCARKRPG